MDIKLIRVTIGYESVGLYDSFAEQLPDIQFFTTPQILSITSLA